MKQLKRSVMFCQNLFDLLHYTCPREDGTGHFTSFTTLRVSVQFTSGLVTLELIWSPFLIHPPLCYLTLQLMLVCFLILCLCCFVLFLHADCTVCACTAEMDSGFIRTYFVEKKSDSWEWSGTNWIWLHDAIFWYHFTCARNCWL